MGAPITIDPSAFKPIGAPPGAEPIVPTPAMPAGKKAISIDPAAFKPISKYPDVGSPERAAEGAAEGATKGLAAVFLPHDDTQAALTVLGAGLPFAGKAAGLAEESMPWVARGLEYLGGKGLGPMLSRVGVNAGVGALTGGKEGAVEGAEVGAVGEVPAPIAAKMSGLRTAEQAGAEPIRESAADIVAQRALENDLGTTTQQAQKLATPMTPGEGAQPLAGAKKAVGEARQSAIREVGQKYEPIYGPIAKNPAPQDRLTQIAGAARGANEWAASRGARLSPSTQKLLTQMEAIAPTNVSAVAQGGGKFRLTNEQIAALQQQSDEGITGLDTQTIGKLRGTLGQVVAEANRPTSSAIDRRVLLDASKPILETLNDAVPEEQRPLLQSINNEYAQINRLFPFKDLKKLQSAATLPQLGEMVFSKDGAPATAMALSRMNPDQKDLMRQAFASYVLKDGEEPTVTLSKLQANKNAVAALYPNSDFGKIETWRQMMISQRKFQQGPPNLPSQKQFEQGIQEAIKKSGLTPQGIEAANKALTAGNTRMPYILKYATTWGLIGAIGGFGIFGHAPELIPVAAAYGAGHLGWRAIASNPEALDQYRKFIMSPWTRASGDAFGRLLVGAANAALHDSAPEHQATGHIEPGEGMKSLKTSQAESLAPTPSAAERAENVMTDLGKDKTPDVHHDLTRGRLSLEEVNKLVKIGSKKDATAMLDEVPISEAMDALEMANPEERQVLAPLVKQKMMENFKGGNYNRTMAASLAKRFQAVQGNTDVGSA